MHPMIGSTYQLEARGLQLRRPPKVRFPNSKQGTNIPDQWGYYLVKSLEDHAIFSKQNSRAFLTSLESTEEALEVPRLLFCLVFLACSSTIHSDSLDPSESIHMILMNPIDGNKSWGIFLVLWLP